MNKIHPQTEIGLVQLKISNMETSLRFYQEVIGLKLIRREGAIAELSVDGVNPLLILEENPLFQKQRSRRTSGLYHFAILLPDRQSLGIALRNLIRHQIPVGQGDHLVSEALYLDDPDGNGIEIYADRPRDTWKRDEHGGIIMTTDPVDVSGLMAISEGLSWQGLPAGTKIGHIHLHVGDLQVAEHFYCEVIGFDRITTYGDQALFISAGGYHHHIGLNTWAGKGAPPAPEQAAGLRYYSIHIPDGASLQEILTRLETEGTAFAKLEDQQGIALKDPFGNGIKLVVADLSNSSH